MTLRDDLLPVVDDLRELPDEFGLRRYSVKIRRRAWSGIKPGQGTPTDVDVEIQPRPKVREVTTQEIADSGGTWRQGDFKVDKVTPHYVDGLVTGGYTPSQLNIRPSGINQDVCFILTGDEGPFECQLIEIHFERSFTYWMVVRRTITSRG